MKKLACFIAFIATALTIDAQINIVKDAYTDKKSYFPGEKAMLYLSSENIVNNAKVYVLNMHEQKVDSIICKVQPQVINQSLPSENGFGYDKTTEYLIPMLKSGVYSIDNKTFFIVKNKQQNASITIVYPTNSDAAYNNRGGKNLYGYSQAHSTQVSFLRPEPDASHYNKMFINGFLHWSLNLTYDIQWICDMDLDEYESINNSKIIMIVGHSEYWTREARKNFDRFVTEGHHAIILSGNTMWWQVRYSNDKKSMICYKDVNLDPINDSYLKTIEWNKHTLEYPIVKSIGADWVNGSFGNKGGTNVNGGYKILNNKSPLLEGCNLSVGQIIKCITDEFDGIPIVGYSSSGIPLPEQNELNFCRIEIIATEGAQNLYGKKGNGNIFLFQKSENSGITINTSSTEWCSGYDGIKGKDSLIFRKITTNAIEKLLNEENVFTNSQNICINTKNNEIKSVYNLKAYPNPANNFVYIDLDEEQFSQDLQISVYNILGKKENLSIIKNENKIMLNTEGLCSGVYFLEISGQGFFESTKILISR